MHIVAFVTNRKPVNRSIGVPKAQNMKYTLEQAIMMMMMMMMMMTHLQYIAEA